MNLDELGSTFKEILLTPPEHLSYESQQKFQNLLRHTPSPTLFKLRSLLDMMQANISQKNYKTYSTLLRSLLDTQESLPGRISPDILEPVTDMHQLRPGNSIGAQDSIEITTGTSIWALYLKRQIQEKNRIDQRQLKSVYLIKCTVLNAFHRTIYSVFLSLYHWNKRNKLRAGIIVLTDVVRKKFKTILRSCRKMIKSSSNARKTKKRGLSCIVNRIKGVQNSHMTRFFKEWYSLSIMSYSYSCISPIFPEKEESEALIKLNETLTVTNEKNEKIVKNTLTRLGYIIKRRNRNIYSHIKLVLDYENSSKIHKDCSNHLMKETKLGKMAESISGALRLQLFNYLKKWKIFTSLEHYKEKCLKTVTKFLHFRLLNVFNLLGQKVFHQKLVSYKLLKILSKIPLNQVRKCFFDLLTHQEFLLKKGFDMLIHNKFKKNLERMSERWKAKLKFSEFKYNEKNSSNLSNFRAGTFFHKFCENYTEKLVRHSFRSLNNLTKS